MRQRQRHGLRGWRCWPILFGFLWVADATGQTVYRCGNSYSQSICPGAVIVPVDDARSAAQKAQTDAATRQALQMAAALEQQRVAVERAARTGAPARGNSKAAATPRPPASSATTKKLKRAPEFFTAAAARDPATTAAGGGKPADPRAH